jgi:hypothetical protein
VHGVVNRAEQLSIFEIDIEGGGGTRRLVSLRTAADFPFVN